MHSVHHLREELAAIQHALAEDALDRLPPLVQDYHEHLRVLIASGIHDASEPVRQLRDQHHAVIAALQQRQYGLRVKMQAERHGSRAARAYLGHHA